MGKVVPEEYETLPLVGMVVVVTEENMHDVAAWCGGEVTEKRQADGSLLRFIKVPTVPTAIERNRQARVNDAVVRLRKGWKVYNPEAFKRSFRPKNRRVQIHQDTDPSNYGSYPGYETMNVGNHV